MYFLYSHNSKDMSLSKFQELVMEREAWRAAVHGDTKSNMGHDWATELKLYRVIFIPLCYSFLVDIIGKEINKLFNWIFIVVVCEQLICGLAGIEATCYAGDPGSIRGSERSPEKGMATHSSTLA